jgi:nitrite reductase/ring-hydroxylating ferredoxin subunit
MAMRRRAAGSGSVILLQRAGRRFCSTATQLELLSAVDAAQLTTTSARQLTVRVPDAEAASVRLLDIFVVRAPCGTVRAFENHCPHAGGPLNMFPDRFFAKDERLICTRHGAKFNPTSGECFHGPCAGQSLHSLPVEVDDTGAIRAAVASLRTLCAEGGGAYVLCAADSPEAGGPPVQRPQQEAPPSLLRRRRGRKPVLPREPASAPSDSPARS